MQVFAYLFHRTRSHFGTWLLDKTFVTKEIIVIHVHTARIEQTLTYCTSQTISMIHFPFGTKELGTKVRDK